MSGWRVADTPEIDYMPRIKAPIQLTGQSRSCPGCTLRFVVQRTAPEDAGPILLFDHLPDSLP